MKINEDLEEIKDEDVDEALEEASKEITEEIIFDEETPFILVEDLDPDDFWPDEEDWSLEDDSNLGWD